MAWKTVSRVPLTLVTVWSGSRRRTETRDLSFVSTLETFSSSIQVGLHNHCTVRSLYTQTYAILYVQFMHRLTSNKRWLIKIMLIVTEHFEYPDTVRKHVSFYEDNCSISTVSLSFLFTSGIFSTYRIYLAICLYSTTSSRRK